MPTPRSSHGRTLLALTAGLMLAAPSVGADEEDGGFTFQLDPLVLEVLETDLDTESSKFEEYRDLGSGFRLPELRLLGSSADGERQFRFVGHRVDRQDARYQVSYGVSGRYRVEVDVRKIPHRFGNNGTFLWNQTAPGRFEVPDSTQAFLQGEIEARRGNGSIDHSFLNGLVNPILAETTPVDISLQRDRTHARLEFGTLAGFSWGIDYEHENRDGNRAYGGSFGFFNVTEILEPIDYDTTEVHLGGEWSGKRGGVQVGYRYSRFENQISTLIWDNPFRITDSTSGRAYLGPSNISIDGPVTGFADLAPDNEASHLYLSGRARAAGWWMHGNASYGVMEQNDPLLPYTLNTAIVGVDPFTGATFDPTNPANLPSQRADTEVQVTTLTASAGRRFGDGWNLTFRGRYYDYDNRSERLELPGYVRYHAAWQDEPRITVPYAYRRQEIGAELAKDIGKKSQLSLGYRLKSWDREFRETETTDEDILRLTFDTKPSSKVNLRASYELGDRSIDSYATEAQLLSFLQPHGINNQPGLRKYTQAARQTDALRLAVNVFPQDNWNLNFNVSLYEEDYDESEFGLINDEVVQLGAELDYTPGESMNVFVFGHYADRQSFQRARQSGGTLSTDPNNDWSATLDEVTDTWGLGLQKDLGRRCRLDLTARWSRSDGEADLFTPPGGSPSSAVDIDNYEDIELFSLISRFDFEIAEHISAGFTYRYEDFLLDRFILQGLQAYLPAALLLSANEGDYEANIFGVDLRLSF